MAFGRLWRYGSRISIEELATLSGWRQKTANLVVTVGYGEPSMCGYARASDQQSLGLRKDEDTGGD